MRDFGSLQSLSSPVHTVSVFASSDLVDTDIAILIRAFSLNSCLFLRRQDEVGASIVVQHIVTHFS